MSIPVHFKKRWLESSEHHSQRVKLNEPASFVDLDFSLLLRIACLLPLKCQNALFLSCKKGVDAITLYRARELGYKGTDLHKAQERVRKLSLHLQFFQEQDLRTGFSHGSTDLEFEIPLSPQFPFQWDKEKKKKIFPHPLTLLLGPCKGMKLDRICTWFLLNPNCYMTEETLWIDFFEVKSSWSQVPQIEKWTSTSIKAMLYHVLTYACYFHRSPLIHLLLDRGAPVEFPLSQRDRIPNPLDKGKTLPKPLESLIALEDHHLIQKLISHGAKVTSESLLVAMQNEKRVNISVLQYLFPFCAKPLDSFNLLDRAIQMESREAIELFFKQGCLIDKHQALTLMYLFMVHRIKKMEGCSDPFASFILPLLVEKGANLNGICPANCSLLHVAASSGSLKWAKWLLKQGADVDQKHPHQGFTPLYLACENLANTHQPTKEDLKLIQLLLGKGSKPILTGEDQDKSPYFLAQRNGSRKIIEIFDRMLNTYL